MADTFPAINPSYGAQGKTDFKTLDAEFGDGYSQRAADGLNSTPITWMLTWEARPNADIATIYDFLIDKLGFEYFLWTAPGDTERKWICKDPITKTPVSAESSGYTTLKATFTQVFDL